MCDTYDTYVICRYGALLTAETATCMHIGECTHCVVCRYGALLTVETTTFAHGRFATNETTTADEIAEGLEYGSKDIAAYDTKDNAAYDTKDSSAYDTKDSSAYDTKDSSADEATYDSSFLGETYPTAVSK